MSQQHLTHLDHLLGSRTRARLVTIIVSPYPRTLHFRALVRAADCGIGFARKEIATLERMRVIRCRRTGRHGLFFDPNESHPLFCALERLVEATRMMDDGKVPACIDERMPYEYRGDEFYPHKVRGTRISKRDIEKERWRVEHELESWLEREPPSSSPEDVSPQGEW